MTMFTVGYGGRDRAEMLTILRTHQVRNVVDIRLRPDRASMGIWVKAKTPDKGIEKWLTEAGFGYVSLVELGNVFLDFADWEDRYQQLLDRAGALLTARLATVPGPLCLLCAEKSVQHCHRRRVADYAVQHLGATVHHVE